MNRRSFFTKLRNFSAIMALAPQIAFRVPVSRIGVDRRIECDQVWIPKLHSYQLRVFNEQEKQLTIHWSRSAGKVAALYQAVDHYP